MSKSPDAFRTIREVADWLGVAAHVLRFWESKFSQIRPVKRAGGRRYYRPSDMALVGGIKVLLHDRGMTVRGVQRMLREEGVAAVSALSPPLDHDEAASELVEGIAEEAAWAEDAAAEAAGAERVPEPQVPDAEHPPAASGVDGPESAEVSEAAPDVPAGEETEAPAAVPGASDMPAETPVKTAEPAPPGPLEPVGTDADATAPPLPGFFRHTPRRQAEPEAAPPGAPADMTPGPGAPAPPGAAASLDRLAALTTEGTAADRAALVADLQRLRDRIGRPVAAPEA